MKRNSKPVRKCHGCGLNFDDHCGVFASPHAMWHHRSCPGYQNEAMLQEYLAEQARRVEDERKEKRRIVAKLRATETHHQGVRDPAWSNVAPSTNT